KNGCPTHEAASAGLAGRIGIATRFMAKLIRQAVWLILCAAAVVALAANAQVPLPRPRPQTAPVTNVTVDGTEAMFTTMCALLAAGFEADVSAENWQPFRAQIRD